MDCGIKQGVEIDGSTEGVFRPATGPGYVWTVERGGVVVLHRQLIFGAWIVVDGAHLLDRIAQSIRRSCTGATGWPGRQLGPSSTLTGRTVAAGGGGCVVGGVGRATEGGDIAGGGDSARGGAGRHCTRTAPAVVAIASVTIHRGTFTRNDGSGDARV